MLCLDQLKHLISESDNPEGSLKKIKDSLILDVTKIIDNYTPSQKNDDILIHYFIENILDLKLV